MFETLKIFLTFAQIIGFVVFAVVVILERYPLRITRQDTIVLGVAAIGLVFNLTMLVLRLI